MGFRDQVVAEKARSEGLEAEVAQLTKRAERAEAENARLREELEGLRTGASEEAKLRGDAYFGIGQVMLPIVGLVGALLSVLVWVNGVASSFYGQLDLSAGGVRRFLRQLDTAEPVLALLGFVACLLLTASPLLAALGVLRRRKWGWHLAVVTFGLWTACFPPLGLMGLYAFCRAPVRRAFLGPAWHEVE